MIAALGDCSQTDPLTGDLVCTAAESPKGTTLLYTANWNTPAMGGTIIALYPQEVAQQLSSELAAYGLQVSASSYNSPSLFSAGSVSTIQLTIIDTVGHDLFSDAQSVIDSLLKSAVGSSNVISSSLSPVGLAQPGFPQATQSTPTPPPVSGGSSGGWFSNLFSGSGPISSAAASSVPPVPTWLWLAGFGVLGIAVLAQAVKR